MPTEPYFDLETARRALKWLKPKIKKLRELGEKGRAAMEGYDLDAADSYTREIHSILEGIRERGIVVRDDEVNLVDFPAVINNMPAYFCWTYGEEDIEYWHYLEDGFAGRTPITGKETVLSYL